MAQIIKILMTTSVVFTFCLLSSCSDGQKIVPEPEWRHLSTEERTFRQWNSVQLESAKVISRQIGSMGWMLVENGVVIDTMGNVSKTFVIQSIRKSLLSALYGIEVDSGRCNLNTTLEELQIDDSPFPLTEREKQSSIKNLLTSRSGIYHYAASSPSHMVASLPQRGSFAPGEHWYYNNWDFNALGTIYQKIARETIFKSFQIKIAMQLQMQDFDTTECFYRYDSVSLHPAYHFSMSLRDLARFGLLYLYEGSWGKRLIISREWINESTNPVTLQAREGYGYMWWVEPKLRSFSARGGSGQLILVIPERNIVFVHSVDRLSDSSATWDDLNRLLRTILNAKKN